VSLVAWNAALPSGATAAGTLSSFVSDSTALACLDSDPPLPVESLPGSNLYAVTARLPDDCANGTWVFAPAANSTSAVATPMTAP